MYQHSDSSGNPGARRYSAPRGSRTRGRLIFTSGLIDIELYGAALMPDFFQAHFVQHVPKILVREDTITVHFRPLPRRSTTEIQQEANGKIALNGTIAWSIEVQGGASNVIANLSHLRLTALDLTSVSHTVIVLPEPIGTSYVYISGSASNVTIRRPEGTACRVQIGHSSSHLRFDDQYFGAISEDVQWQTSQFSSVVNRHVISIAGSASNLTVEEQ